MTVSFRYLVRSKNKEMFLYPVGKSLSWTTDELSALNFMTKAHAAQFVAAQRGISIPREEVISFLKVRMTLEYMEPIIPPELSSQKPQ